ncbi:MAG: hypothetical protein AMXMBFR44_2560 [Candidatus Campbellbacteria bacterium]
MKILVIDQVDSSREHVVRRLRELFPDVEVVETGHEFEGIQIARSQKGLIAILVADYPNVPGVRGMAGLIISALSQEFRSLADRADVPICLMTSDREELAQTRGVPGVNVWQSFEAPHQLYRLMKQRDRQNPRPARRGF